MIGKQTVLLILIKTEYLLFQFKNINVPVSINLNLNTISPSECAKKPRCNFFQSDMSMDKHISSVVKNLFSISFVNFRHIRSFHPKNLLLLYLQMPFYIPRIDYCNSLFLRSAQVLN